MGVRALAILSTCACLACASAPPPAPSLSETRAEDLVGCVYRTFATSIEYFPEAEVLADRDLLRDIEDIYADGLEEWGWRRVGYGERAAFVLEAIVSQSNQRSDIVQGVIEMSPLSTTHRDATFARMDGALDASPFYYLGFSQVTEIFTRRDSVASSTRSAIVEDGKWLARGMEQESIARLCSWRKELAEEGLEIEEIRAELVLEMVEVRKRARQRKELKIRAEEAQ